MSNAWRTALTVVALGSMAGCAQLIDPRGTSEVATAIINERESDRAMAALTRGDYPNAERLAVAALRKNSKDPYGLIVSGLVHQGTGRYDLARQYYEVIITNHSQGTMMVPGENGVMVPKSIVDVARSNLAVIDKVTGRYIPRSAAQSGRPPGASAVGAPPLPSIEPTPMPARADIMTSSLDPLPPSPGGMAGMPGRVSDAESNVSGRFRILKRLLDEGLITPTEFSARRNANAGALLPYSSAVQPSQGLERPIPGEDALLERMKALGVALEGREINPKEHAAERTVILDQLLPAAPRKAELPALPPRDMLEAASAVGRVERLRAAGLISADEAKKERESIEKMLDRRLANSQVSGSSTGLRHGMPSAEDGSAAWGVNLGYATTEVGANKSWASLQKKFPSQLAGLEPVIRKGTVKGKGVRWQVVAGPIPSKDAATGLCKTLKAKSQSCTPATFAK